MKEERQLNENYEEIAMELIENEPVLAYIKNSPVRIAFLESNAKRRHGDHVVFGQCEKVSSKNKWAIHYDYTITVFQPNVEFFTEEQIRILLLHELLHIKIELGADGKIEYSMLPHDLEDFRYVISTYGVDWDKPKVELHGKSL